jgi:hypothetical protein
MKTTSLLEPVCDEVSLALTTLGGLAVGTLTLQRLPSDQAALLVNASGAVDQEPGVEAIRIMEGGEYRYAIHIVGDAGAIAVDRETFSPDDRSERRGRVKAGLRTGRLRLGMKVGAERVEAAPIEVLSRKLDYLTHYRWMLDAIASLGTGLVIERFAASEQRVAPNAATAGVSPYQRFCFLRGLLREGGVGEALQHIVAQPAIAFEDTEEVRPSGRGVRATSASIRDLTRMGPRVPWAGHPTLTSVPRTLVHRRSEPTTDTEPNRFVRFAVEGWVALLDEIDAGLVSEGRVTGPINRGRDEVASLRSELEAVLHHDVLQSASPLRSFPATNQVLMRRAGYREVFRSWVLTEAGATLSWDGGEDVFGAGQKNVAALYEYWVFLELARIVGSVCEDSGAFSLAQLVVTSPSGWSLDLKRGRELVCSGRVRRLGRELEVRLSFNRTFRHDVANGSWTRQMRPDCTLEVEVVDAAPPLPPMRVHFDAKYKLERMEELQAADDVEDLDELIEPGTKAKAADLLKMHAYRDAIVHAAGAWVVFPGNPQSPRYGFDRWGELLPGLGALALRPAADGSAEGAHHVRTFVSGLLDHVATQTTKHERVRFWERRSINATGAAAIDATPGLLRPPADSRALFGFVRTEEQLHWIRHRGRYNLRADDRNGSVLAEIDGRLDAELVVLFGEGLDPFVEVRRIIGPPLLLTAAQMADDGYLNPRGSLYLVLPLGDPLAAPPWLNRDTVNQLWLRQQGDAAMGPPFFAAWHELQPAPQP